MKKVFLICLSAGFISTGFAQSSVADVPANKIRPASENAAATKTQAASTPQKAVAPQPVLNDAGLTAHDQPNLKPAPAVKKLPLETSVAPTAPSRLVPVKADPESTPSVAPTAPKAKKDSK